MSVYNVYESQNKFVERVTKVVILRMRSLGHIYIPLPCRNTFDRQNNPKVVKVVLFMF